MTPTPTPPPPTDALQKARELAEMEKIYLDESAQECLSLFSKAVQISEAREQRFVFLIEWLEKIFGTKDFTARGEVTISKPLVDELFKHVRRLKGDAKPLQAKESINEASAIIRSQSSQFKRITAERDELLKGYREMRLAIIRTKQDVSAMRDCRVYEKDEIISYLHDLLTSFPEIK